jgi:putative RNA 2'-phosphotransferase
VVERDVRISKFLALVLRHEPERIGLELDDRGWADVDALLARSAAHGMTFTEDDLRRVVATNPKQRYLLDEDRRRIRANQGHSVVVDLGLEPTTPPVELYHGTARRNLEAILAGGLDRMQRRHVHLSGDVETATTVGARHGTPVVLLVAAGTMHTDGHQFFRSENGVWLVAHVPPTYLRVLPSP